MVGVRIGDALVAVDAVGGSLVDALTVAVGRALGPLGGARPDLAMIWVSGATPDDAGEALLKASVATGARTTLGCSAHGVLGAGEAVEASPAVAVWAAVLPGAAVRSFHLETLRTGASLAVLGLPERRDDDEVVLMLADPWSFPADAFVSGGARTLDGLPIVGGLASGAAQAGDSRLLLDGRVVDRGAVGVILGGDVVVHPLVSQGCRPVGPPMTVTSSDGNIIESLAGRRALDQARAVVAGLPDEEQAAAVRGLHLGLAMDEYADQHEAGDFLIRGILGADEAVGAIAVGDTVEVGRTVRFHLRDAEGADDHLAGVLGVSTIGGFFAAGEFGPVGGRNHVHGFTATVLAFESETRVSAADPPPSGRRPTP
jgi:small ligand-binding sensory domain FIST